MVQPPVIINQQDQQELVLQPLLLFHVEHERWQDQDHSHLPVVSNSEPSSWTMKNSEK